jgi:hypothetical protein
MQIIKNFFKTRIPNNFATLSRAWFWGFLFGAGTYYFITTLAKIKGVTI